MEPDAEIKFARVYTAQSLNLDRAGALSKIKFHAARAVLAKTRSLNPPAVRLRSASFGCIGAILDKI